MQLASTVANLGQFNLGRAYDGAANAQPLVGGGMAVIQLDNKMMELAAKWQRDIGKPTIAGVGGHLLESYFREFYRGPESYTGAFISNAMFEHRVLVPLFVTHTGLVLNVRQSDTLKAMTELISVLHVPENMPMGKPQFMFRYIRTTQMLARKGQITTKTGGVVGDSMDINFGLEKYVAGISIGDKEFLTDCDPNQVIAMLKEKLTSLETTWGLTRIHLHARYAASQPSLLQLMCLNNLAHQPRGDGIGRLMQLFFTEHLCCGAINRNGGLLITLLRTFQQLIGDGKREEFVVVTPQIVTDADNIQLQKVTLQLTAGEAVVYNVNKPQGLQGYQLFGEVHTAKGYVNDDVPEKMSVRGGDDPLKDKPALAGVPPVEIQMAPLPNGGKAYIIPVDGTPFTSVPDAQSCDSALKSRGVKRVFFTVGGVPNAFSQYAHAAFFNSLLPGQGGASAITPKNIVEMSPNETYYWNYNTNRPQKVSVAMLHGVVANEKLFNPAFAHEAWAAQFPAEMLNYFNEIELAALINVEANSRIDSPHVIFETDPRMMWIDTAVNVNVPAGGLPRLGFAVAYTPDDDNNGERYRSMVQRGVLGNGSVCSSFENEMVVAVGGMCGIVGSVTSLLELLTVMKVGLETVDPQLIIRFRGIDVANLDYTEVAGRSPAMTTLLTILHKPCLFSDPQCIIKIVAIINKVRNDMINNVQLPPSLANFMNENESQFTKIIELVAQAKLEVKELIKAVYAGKSQYNYLLSAPNALIAMLVLDVENMLFYKFMYGIALPSLTNRIYANGVLPQDAFENTNVIVNDAQNPCPALQLGVYRADSVFVGDTFVIPRDLALNHQILPVYGHPEDRCILRPVFRNRYTRLLTEYSLSDLAKVMGLLHFWTGFTLDTMRNHMDRRYPSGLSYFVLRTMSFLGHDMVGMPIRGARMLVGNRITAMPVNEWSVTDYKQTLEMGMVPVDLTSTGVSCNNVYLTEINGMGAEFDIRNPQCNLIFDSYNYYLPHGIYTYQKELPVLSAFGRFDDEENYTLPDRNLPGNRITLLPTSFLRSSPILKITLEQVGNLAPQLSSVNYIKTLLAEPNFISSVPTHIRVAAMDGIKVEDIMNQVHSPGSKQRSIFTEEFGCIFTDDYTIGSGSSVLFANINAPNINQEFQPRVNSLGGLSPNSGMRNNAEDPKFTQAFLRDLPIGNASLARNF